MKILHFLFPIFFFFLLPCTSQPSFYIPIDNIAVDCGSSATRPSPNGREWTGDVGTKFSPSDQPNATTNSTTKSSIANAVNDPLYTTVRLSRSPFTYSFPVTAGPKFLRLYFSPESYGEFPKFDAFFTVQVGQFTLLKNFSAALVADASRRLFIAREFCIHIGGESPKLNITFTPSPNYYAFVNGIEVVSMPENLYYSSAEQGAPAMIKNNIALELYHRQNLGGDEIKPSQDSGMYRTWTGNNDFVSSPTIIIGNYSVSINYSASTPNFTATDSVYQSALILGLNQTFNSLSNLSMDLPVDVGFNYLVRLHFCQIQADQFQYKQRRFTVFMNDRKVDAIDIDSVNSPMYKDYNVLMANGNAPFIFVDLHPLQSESYDAILNGIEVFKQSNGTNLAVPNPPGSIPPPPEAKALAKKSNAAVITAAACGGVGFAILFSLVGLVVVWKQSKKKTKKKKKKKKTEGSLLPQRRCRIFTFEEILEATDYFNKEREIGVGGFGAVYKGIFEDEDDLTVAIKRLNPDSQQGEQEFKTEIELLSELRHFNLVSLIGYCMEGKEMLLIYEFMPNGTFKDHLYDTPNPPLSWKKRLEICYGAARGLNYLHTGVDRPIIHRDVKTSNILLDENWAARVSDFGMSKLGQSNTAVSTLVKGTWGYLDPDYHRRLKVTEKSDVYSFGVVLFEVLCGRKPLDPLAGEEKFKLTLWAKKCLEKGMVYEIIDPNLKGKISRDCLKQYLELAAACISDQTKHRPTMAVVEEKLRFMLQLQEEADGNCSDGELSYPEEPFSPIKSTVGSLRSESYKTHIATVLSGSDFTASSLMNEDMFGEHSTSYGAQSRNV